MPLGIVAGLFSQARHDAKALGVFLGRYGLTSLTPADLGAWYVNARGLVTNALTSPHSVLQAAAAVVDDLGIGAAAASSELLRHGLEHRLTVLADAVTTALTRPETLPGVESAWTDVQNHFLSGSDPSCRHSPALSASFAGLPKHPPLQRDSPIPAHFTCVSCRGSTRRWWRRGEVPTARTSPRRCARSSTPSRPAAPTTIAGSRRRWPTRRILRCRPSRMCCRSG
ncbi:pglZ domain protein [Mycobacterium xenopi 4042]|uniref:PglZ domain protein n=1 Tax=Mycobacterium xenopi 4042 TaxID=1299334 RepID=X7YNJ3_MYCXE|nr:pglZ domain protein [Mycobacterium xenopi 4042]